MSGLSTSNHSSPFKHRFQRQQHQQPLSCAPEELVDASAVVDDVDFLSHYSPLTKRRILDRMPVCVKVYYGKHGGGSEIRRFNFRPQDPMGRSGIFINLIDRIKSVYNGLNLQEFNLCWKDEDGDYVVFSSDDELKVATNNLRDNTLRVYVREKEQPKTDESPAHNRNGTYSNSSSNHVTFYDEHMTCNIPHMSPTTPQASWNDITHEQLGLYSPPQMINTPRTRLHPTSVSPQFQSMKPSGVSSGFTNSGTRCYEISTPVSESDGRRVVGSVTVEHSHSQSDVNSSDGRTSNESHLSDDMTIPTANGSRGVNSLLTALRSASLEERDQEAPMSCSKCHTVTSNRNVWYKCTVCPNFHICSECEHKGTHDEHNSVRLSQRARMPSPSRNPIRSARSTNSNSKMDDFPDPPPQAPSSISPTSSTTRRRSPIPLRPQTLSPFKTNNMSKATQVRVRSRSPKPTSSTSTPASECSSSISLCVPILAVIWVYVLYSMISGFVNIIVYLVKLVL